MLLNRHGLDYVKQCGINTQENIKIVETTSHITPTIAIIDDEHKWLNVFKRMFRNSKYAVDTYDDPQRFLDTIFAAPRRYTGIICDIKMPRLDGYQVFNAVKSNQATQNIPFLIVSGVLTQDHNLSKVQGAVYISKLDDNLKTKVFQELIEVIENWPKLEAYLRSKGINEEKIGFFCQFFINYHKYFNDILTYVNQMESACVLEEKKQIKMIHGKCIDFLNDLQNTCMDLISLLQEAPESSGFIRKVCERGRTSLNMIQTFQLMLTEETSSNEEFIMFLNECKDTLEKIIIGTDDGYNLRNAG
jgi:CheY-like chemotaxis protein